MKLMTLSPIAMAAKMALTNDATSTLPITRVVNVQSQLTPAGAQTQSLSNLLILTNASVIDTVERMRSYDNIDEVLADFGSAAASYFAARDWFAQKPQPTKVLIGRWARSASQGGLRGSPLAPGNQWLKASNWQAITTGSFSYQLNGGSAANITGLNFSAVTDLNGVAAVITAALSAGATCTWNSVYKRFEFISATTGATSAVSVLSPAGSGTDISAKLNCNAASAAQGGYTYQGIAAEAPADVAALFDDQYGQQWYALFSAFQNDTDSLSFGPLIEAMTNKHIFLFTTFDQATLLGTSTTDLAAEMATLGLQRSLGQFCLNAANNTSVCSAAARLLGVDYNSSNSALTLMFKQEPGIAPLTLAGSQVDVLSSKNINAFLAYNNGTSIFQEGVMCSGEFADTVTGSDWFVLTIQTACYNIMYTSPTKVPQTDAGMNLFVTAIEQVCDQAVRNGFCAPGVWNSSGFGTLKQGDYMPKGYYVYAPPVASQLESDRAARKSVSFQIALKLAGAVHSLLINVVINQ